MLAVLTHHWLMSDLRLFVTAGVVTINSDPVHLALPAHFVMTNNRHVVLRLARDHARRTTGTGIEIDGHAPPVSRGRMIGRPQITFARMALARARRYGHTKLRQR